MIDFCNDNSLLISSQLLLPNDTYSYVCTREGVPYHSWLDHIVSSSDFHKSIETINVLYNMSDEDHIPVCMDINVSVLPNLTCENNDYSGTISWDRIKDCELKKYLNLTDKHFSNIHIPVQALICGDLHCSNNSHKLMLDELFCNITKCLNSRGAKSSN